MNTQQEFFTAIAEQVNIKLRAEYADLQKRMNTTYEAGTIFFRIWNEQGSIFKVKFIKYNKKGIQYEIMQGNFAGRKVTDTQENFHRSYTIINQ